MKINTIAKTVQFDEGENLGQAMDTLRHMFPEGKWKEYNVAGTSNFIQIAPATPNIPMYPWGPGINPLPYDSGRDPMFPMAPYITFITDTAQS